MEINIAAIKQLLEEMFNNNKTKFAETIGISREYVSQLLNGKNDGDSAKVCNAVILFCESNGLDYRKYIILP